MQELSYRNEDMYFPIPENEKNLQTITAEHFVDIPMENVKPGHNILEGLCFNNTGDILYVCNTPMSKIYKVNIDTKEVTLFVDLPEHMMPSSIKIHKDGRLFVTMAGSDNGGLIAIISEEGKILDKIVTGTDKWIDDMVFDRDGGIYFTDLGGSLEDKSAGVYYVEKDYKTIKPVITRDMIATNGIALSPEWKSLWVTEYGAGKLHHFGITEKHTLEPLTSSTPYYFTGLEGPDSIIIDEDGNLYVAMCGQARFLVFNKNGFPIGNILIPGREKGKMGKSTHIALKPDTNEAYMCCADMKTGESSIYVAKVYAKAHKSYQFQ